MREVLLVEDEEIGRKITMRFFRGKQYRFHEAGSVSEAIAIIEAHPQIQVALVDIELGRGKSSGIKFAEYLKNRRGDYRVIVLTAHEEQLRATEAAKNSVFTYLAKASKSKESLLFTVDQAFKDLDRAALDRKLQRLLAIQERINKGAPLKETLDLLCNGVLETIGGYTCHIRLYDFGKGDYETVGYAGEESLRRIFEPRRARGEFFTGKVVQTKQPDRIDDLQTDRRFKELRRREASAPLTAHESAYWDQVRSAYIVPIFTRVWSAGQVDALLNVNSVNKEYFDSARCELVAEFVTQATLAITKNWLQLKRLAVHKDYQRIASMLSEVTEKLKGRDVLNGIFRIVTREISEIVAPEIVSIFDFDESTGRIDKVAENRGGTPETKLDESYLKGESLTGTVWLEERTIHIPDIASSDLEDLGVDPKSPEKYLRDIPSGGIKHYVGIPIRIGDEVHGVLRAVNKRSDYYDAQSAAANPLCLLERGFSDDCINAMEIAARYLGVAMQNAGLVREKDQQFERMRALAEASRIVNSQLDQNKVLKGIIEKMASMMEAEICMLFLKDESGQRIVLQAAHGLGPGMLAGASYRLGQGVTGDVAKTGVPRLIPKSVRNDGLYDPEIRAYLSGKYGEPKTIESLMVVPIKRKDDDKILGVMKVINKLDQLEYTEDDLNYFVTFADYVDIAIFNAQEYKAATERLTVAERNAALSQLVRAVAHEINNTFGTISATVEGIRARLGGPSPDIERMLARIEDAANQTTEFATEISGYSAGRAGSKEPRDINEIIAKAVGAINHSQYDVWGFVSLDENYYDDPLVCDVYANPFSQVVRNIVINALQAMADKPGSKLSITSEAGTGESEGKAIVRFRDNGPGIRPEFLPDQIFEPEFTTKSTGNGVGLWLVRSQLQLIGAQIDVESTYGEGATFTLQIPLADQRTSP